MNSGVAHAMFFEGTLFHDMLVKKITLHTLSCSLLLFDYISLCRVLAIRCPHLTSKSHSLVLSLGHIISSICGKDEIQFLFCGAQNLSFLWSVPHGFTCLFFFTGCDVLGLRLATLKLYDLLMYTWTSLLH